MAAEVVVVVVGGEGEESVRGGEREGRERRERGEEGRRERGAEEREKGRERERERGERGRVGGERGEGRVSFCVCTRQSHNVV